MKLIYLDNAATSFPKPPQVISETVRCMREYGGNPGRSSHILSKKAAEKIFECRCAASDFFDAEGPENVVFTYNTTYALNIAAKSFLKSGDHVIISNIEHNSVLRPAAELARRGIINYDMFSWSENPENVISDIKSKIRANTAAVICAHASNVCGAINPIYEIGQLCRKSGLYFIVDAAQSAGILNIDMNKMNIDALCVPGHKGLYAPQGSAMILFSGEKQTRKCSTFIEGGNGISSYDDSMPDFLPEKYEAGTLAAPCIAGLLEGIKWVSRRGTENILEHEKKLSINLINMLRKIDGVKLYTAGETLGTFMFNIDGIDSETVAKLLDDEGICVRSGFHCSPLAHKMLDTGESGAVRISFGAFNKNSDSAAVANAVKNIVNKKI